MENLPKKSGFRRFSPKKFQITFENFSGSFSFFKSFTTILEQNLHNLPFSTAISSKQLQKIGTIAR